MHFQLIPLKATMQEAIIFVMLAAFAQARYTPILPPMPVHKMLQNSTINASAGQNSTMINDKPSRNYNTTSYKVYIGFMVFGAIAAVFFLLFACSFDAWKWYRGMGKGKEIKQRKVDVEWAKAKMREMTKPPAAYVRPERYG